jgi:flagellar hook-basal body complex protein FliE
VANAFWITQSCAKSMMDNLAASIDAGTAAVINIYDGTPPASADAALSSNNLLAQLTCSTTAFGAATTANPSVLTANAISSDTSADSTGTASFFRILTQNAGTVCAQGTAGTASADLILNTTSLTSGSTVAITSATISLPTG